MHVQVQKVTPVTLNFFLLRVFFKVYIFKRLLYICKDYVDSCGFYWKTITPSAAQSKMDTKL